MSYAASCRAVLGYEWTGGGTERTVRCELPSGHEGPHERHEQPAAQDQDGFYETVACGGAARIGHVPERTQNSREVRDAHLADPDILAKHRPWVVRGGSVKTGPFRVVSTKTPWVGFSVAAGWPEIQEALAIKLASMLNGESDA